MLRTGLALLLTSSGCAVVTQEGALQSVAPFRNRCEDHSVRAHLVRAGEGELELSATSTGACQDGEVKTFKVERYYESWVPAGIVGVLVGSIIEVPVLVATFWLLGKSSSSPNLGNAGWVIVLPGIVVGGAVAAAIGSTHFRLPDAEPRQFEEITANVERTDAAQGFVVVEADPSLKFELLAGRTQLPIEKVWNQDLGRLLVNGVLVEYDEASRPLVIQLSSCRRAVSGWHLGAEGTCDQERERLAWAKTCHAAGYPYADEVLGRLQSMGCE